MPFDKDCHLESKPCEEGTVWKVPRSKTESDHYKKSDRGQEKRHKQVNHLIKDYVCNLKCKPS